MARQGDGQVVVPPTLQALLAARLDQLEPVERSVLERGAVEGEIFHRGAVQALVRDGSVTPRLASLIRKHLIRPDNSRLPDDDAFRFRHLLIRDAAYESIPKGMRAELHERFAIWLEERGTDLVELDELLGHHLEQAARYKRDLGRSDPVLAERAGERLAAAGRRALWRDDRRAAAVLLERALTLIQPIRLDVHLELDLASALSVDERNAAATAEAAAQRAREAGDRVGEALARTVAAAHRSEFAVDPAIDELEALARAALPLLERVEDHAGLVHCWWALRTVAHFRCRNEECAHAAEQAIRHAHLAGQADTHLFGLPIALVVGPRPADEALRALDTVLLENPHPYVVLNRAILVGMLGRFGEARSIAQEASRRLRELTGDESLVQNTLAEIAIIEGDHDSAVRYLRGWCDFLEAHGLRARLSTFAPRLGRELCALGRYDEAEALAQLGRNLGDEQDLMTQMIWRQVQARVHADRGEHAEAEALAREAVAIAERTDGLNWQGDALSDLAEVLEAAGRTDEAAAALEEALERYERKKNLAMVAQVRPRLKELRAGVT